jgi:NAD(P)-dependent dehydrogenase (short-subunit alcohol dehydrogenase family)
MSKYSEFSLAGKVVIVTGASSGIGMAVAEAMAGAGAKVALVGRNKERLVETARGIPECYVISVDLTTDAAPRRIVDETVAAFGKLDVVVHSAGIFLPTPFPVTPLAELDEQYRVNLRAPYALTQAALPHLIPNGVVIFISSIAGRIAFPNSSAYCATKGAVEQLTKALAVELSPKGIRFNAIAPGNVHTPMNERFFKSESYNRTMIERTPYGRVGVPSDIASLAVFLASDAARYIHGASIPVDGGWSAQ